MREEERTQVEEVLNCKCQTLTANDMNKHESNKRPQMRSRRKKIYIIYVSYLGGEYNANLLYYEVKKRTTFPPKSRFKVGFAFLI
jgi:hypothetical protein